MTREGQTGGCRCQLVGRLIQKDDNKVTAKSVEDGGHKAWLPGHKAWPFYRSQVRCKLQHHLPLPSMTAKNAFVLDSFEEPEESLTFAAARFIAGVLWTLDIATHL